MSEPAHADAGPLLRRCAAALGAMYDERAGLFASSTRVVDGRYVNTFDHPSAQRYSINTLAGLQRAVEHDAVGWDVESAIERLLRGRRATGLGDRGLLLHVLARAGHDEQDRLFAAIERDAAGEDVERRVDLQEICWLVLGLVTYARERSSARAQGLAARLLDIVDERYGDPRAPLPDFTASRWRRGLVSFGALAYYLMATASYATAFDDERVGQRFRRATSTVLELQGPRGEWPWFIDARQARVLDWYQVYSVHQYAMAMLFLLPARDLGLPGVPAAIERSVRWVLGANELSVSMLCTEPFVIWRSIRRRGRGERARRYLRAALPGAGARWADPASLELNRECRSYELGWLLYAWSGRDDVPAAVAELSAAAGA